VLEYVWKYVTLIWLCCAIQCANTNAIYVILTCSCTRASSDSILLLSIRCEITKTRCCTHHGCFKERLLTSTSIATATSCVHKTPNNPISLLVIRIDNLRKLEDLLFLDKGLVLKVFAFYCQLKILLSCTRWIVALRYFTFFKLLVNKNVRLGFLSKWNHLLDLRVVVGRTFDGRFASVVGSRAWRIMHVRFS
jgi:hypothetical protein